MFYTLYFIPYTLYSKSEWHSLYTLYTTIRRCTNSQTHSQICCVSRDAFHVIHLPKHNFSKNLLSPMHLICQPFSYMSSSHSNLNCKVCCPASSCGVPFAKVRREGFYYQLSIITSQYKLILTVIITNFTIKFN